MIPHIITLSGAIGIKAGLNRDDLRIDLDERLPGEAVTVAIIGDNGTGKSTVLNLGLTPWLSPPQVNGNIYDHFGPTGSRELEWSHGGTRYKSIIQYRQSAKTKTTKATLYRLTSTGAWEPMRLPDGLVSDGKTTTYEACLSHVLGPQSLYFLSAFRAQNAIRLADYDDPKGLMRDLLHLDDVAALTEITKGVVAELKRRLPLSRAECVEFAHRKRRADELEIDIQGTDQHEPELRQAKELAQESHAIRKAELEAAVSAGIDQARLGDARKKVEERLRERSDRRLLELRHNDQESLSAEATYRRHKDALQREKTAVESDILAARSRAERATGMLSRAEEITSAASMLSEITETQVALDEAIVEIRARVDAKRAAALEMTNISSLIAQVVMEGKHLRSRVDDLSHRAGYIQQVPCLGLGEYADCPALIEAHQAETQIRSVEAERKAKLADFRRLEADKASKEKVLLDMGDPETELRHAERTARANQERLRQLQPIAALLPQLDTAQRQIDEEEALIARLGERMLAANAALSEREAEYYEAREAVASRRAGIQESARIDLDQLRDELAAMPSAEESTAIDQAKLLLREADAALVIATGDLDTHIATQAQRKAELAALRRAIESGSEIHKTAKRIENEIAHWTLLGVALKGVIDLSIEDAGPSIAAIANKLLLDAYGPRFTVRIVTQREQQNGRLVECFDISVIDSESGIESSITKKSGGETVWLDKALTDAVGLYHQGATGVDYEALFADEAEDGLTEERKLMFYRMDRAALEMGGYRRKFFVSHNPSAWDMADAVIDMNELRA